MLNPHCTEEVRGFQFSLAIPVDPTQRKDDQLFDLSAAATGSSQSSATTPASCAARLCGVRFFVLAGFSDQLRMLLCKCYALIHELTRLNKQSHLRKISLSVADFPSAGTLPADIPDR